jgi:hypothetical protein
MLQVSITPDSSADKTGLITPVRALALPPRPAAAGWPLLSGRSSTLADGKPAALAACAAGCRRATS